MDEKILFALILSSVICFIFSIIRGFKQNILTLCLKILSSISVVFLGIIICYNQAGVGFFTKYNIFILVGMLFGLLGDVVLDLKIMYKEDGDKYLIAGFLSFAVGHIFYALAIFKNLKMIATPNLTLWALLLVFGAAILCFITLVGCRVMKADFGENKLPTTAYTLVLCYMMCLGVYSYISDKNMLIMMIGILSFAASDVVLSQIYFVPGKAENKFLIIINHLLYYAGQIMIMLSMLAFYKTQVGI